MRSTIVWSGLRSAPTAELSQDAAITFDPSSGFSERDGKLWLTPCLDPESWEKVRKPSAIEARAYEGEIQSDLSAEALLGLPFTADALAYAPRPGWVPLAIENLKPSTQYSFIIFAHYDQ